MLTTKPPDVIFGDGENWWRDFNNAETLAAIRDLAVSEGMARLRAAMSASDAFHTGGLIIDRVVDSNNGQPPQNPDRAPDTEFRVFRPRGDAAA